PRHVPQRVMPMTLSWQPFAPDLSASPVGLKRLLACARALAALPPEMNPAERLPGIERARIRAAADANRDESPAAALVALHLLADLARPGWAVRARGQAVQIAWPPPSATDDEARGRTRAQLLVERDEQLRQPAVRKFIRSMEARTFHANRFVS